MPRRAFFAFGLALGLCLAGLPLAACAQQAGKPWRVGYLGNSPPTDADAARIWASFQKGMEDRGYISGKNVVFERRYAEGLPDRYPVLAAELVNSAVDVIVVASSDAAYAVKATGSRIPVVMISVADPVGRGLIKSLAHPGGTMTGLASFGLDLVPKRLDQLKTTLPKGSRVAFIRCLACLALDNPAEEAARTSAWAAAAHELGLTLLQVDLSTRQDFESATAAVLRLRPDAIFLGQTPVSYILREQLAEFALRQRLPLFAAMREQVTAGGLMSYGPSVADQFREAAIYVDKILKGARPGDLPVEQPAKIELVINLKTARTLGLTIPQSLLLRADEIIQ